VNVVDSSGWIEYFLNSLLEVHRFLSRTFLPDQRDICLGVMRRAQVVDLTDSRAVAASNVMTLHKLAMADAIMYSIAQEFKATFWTQDIDYQGLPGVQYKARV
jgi:toxin FitB